MSLLVLLAVQKPADCRLVLSRLWAGVFFRAVPPTHTCNWELEAETRVVGAQRCPFRLQSQVKQLLSAGFVQKGSGWEQLRRKLLAMLDLRVRFSKHQVSRGSTAAELAKG